MKELEKFLEKLHKNFPHMPLRARKWLAKNIWWIVLLLAISSGIQAANLLYSTIVAVLYTMTNYSYTTIPLWSNWVQSVLMLAGMIAVTVLMASAVEGLKSHHKSAWNMVFYAVAINLVITGFVSILYVSLTAAINALIGAAIGWYFLYEVRSLFAHKHK